LFIFIFTWANEKKISMQKGECNEAPGRSILPHRAKQTRDQTDRSLKAKKFSLKNQNRGGKSLHQTERSALLQKNDLFQRGTTYDFQVP